MAEVFSISGASLGATACPVGWQATPNGNCGAPAAGCPSNMRLGAACRSAAAIALQNAVRALGRQVGDPVLAALAVDGFVGPKTTEAVNRAFTTHIGSGQAPADVRTGALSLTDVATRAPQLTQLASAEVVRRGGAVPAPPAMKATPAAAKAATGEDLAPIAGDYPNALWALVGLNALAAVTGAWGVYRRNRGEPVYMPARRARYA